MKLLLAVIFSFSIFAGFFAHAQESRPAQDSQLIESLAAKLNGARAMTVSSDECCYHRGATGECYHRNPSPSCDPDRKACECYHRGATGECYHCSCADGGKYCE